MADVQQPAQDEARRAYYIDQVVLIGAAGAVAAVTILLWRNGLLGKMLHEKFHIWVALGGFALLGLVVVRAAALWTAVDDGDPHAGHDHGGGGHDHGHSHSHGHAHSHGGEACTHDHGGAIQPTPTGASLAVVPAAEPKHDHGHSHSHGHGHAHSHGHSHSHGEGGGGHDDHDHAAAPWRYVVLLFPVFLYFLVLWNPAFDREPIASPTSPLDHIQNFVIIFRGIFWEALPFIILGAVVAGMLEELLPQRVLVSVLPKSRTTAVLLGGLLGIVFPMCECGIIPIMRRLLRKGLPLSCCIAYLLAGPIINVVVLLSTYAAFSGMENAFEGSEPSYQMGGWYMMGFRAGLGYLTAILTGLIVEWQYKKHGNTLLTPLARPGDLPMVEEEVKAERRPLGKRLSNISATALHDFVDISVFLIMGAALAAGTRLFLTSEQVAELGRNNWAVAILAMMGLAVVLCLCSEADAFVAASFVTLRPSAKLAFLVLGPMMDLKLYFMYTRIFRPRLIAIIYGAVVLQVFLYSAAVHAFWERYAPNLITPERSKVATVSEEEGERQSLRAAGSLAVALSALDAGSPVLLSVPAMMTLPLNYDVPEITFSQLEKAAETDLERSYFQGKLVRLVGRFTPTGADNVFTLSRLKMNCCAADAQPIKSAIRLDTTAVPDAKLASGQLRDKWVRVEGRVEFYSPDNRVYRSVLNVRPTPERPLAKVVEPVPPPVDPYVN